MATMDGLERLLPYALPIGIALFVIALVVLAWVAITVRRAALVAVDEEVAEDAAGKEEKTLLADAVLIGEASLSKTFAKAMRTLRRAVSGRGYRYALPWAVMLGETGAGKSAAINAVDVVRPFPRPAEDGAVRDCEFHFFDHGVVLDLSGRFVAMPDGSPADEAGWRHFTRLLQKHRPERALDAVVVAIPAADLVGPNRLPSEMLAEKAEALYRRLWDLQQQTGLRLPVYVMVTKCDSVPGFRSFWAAAPERRRREMFGWSNNRTLDAAFGTHLVDEAFDEIVGDLLETYVEIVAGTDDLVDGDAVLMFPEAFGQLREPLKIHLDRLLRISSYHDAFFFRGLYFIGDAAESKSRALIVLDGVETEDPVRAAPASRRPFFVTDLFTEKIFREAALAQPARRGLISRNRSVLTVQIATALTVVLLCVGTWVAHDRIKQGIASLEPPLSRIAEDVVEHRSRMGGGVATGGTRVVTADPTDARYLLTQLSSIDIKTLHTVFLPPSWFSRIEDRIVTLFISGVQSMILDPIEIGLERKADLLIETAAAASVADAQASYAFVTSPAFVRLERYVREIRTLEDHTRLYNNLDKTPSLQDVRVLGAYVLDIRLEQSFLHNSELYGRALDKATIVPFDPTLRAPAAGTAALRLYEDFARQLAVRGPILDRFRRLASAIDGFVAAEYGQSGIDDALEGLMTALLDVQRMLQDPQFAWVLLDSPTDSPEFAALIGMLETSEFFGPELAGTISAAAVRDFEAFKTELSGIRTRNGGPLLENQNGRLALRLSQDLERLAVALQTLVSQPFMQDRDPGVLMSDTGAYRRLIWKIDLLKHAVGLYGAYESFVAGGLPDVPPRFQQVVDRLAQERLRDAMLVDVIDAQTFETREADVFGGIDEADLLREVANFREASASLGRIMTIFSQLGFGDAYASLRDVAGEQANGLLSRLDDLADLGGPYQTIDGFRYWQGTTSPLTAGFGVRDDVEAAQYLDAQRMRLGRLSDEIAAPLFTFLLRSDYSADWRTMPLAVKWQRIALELNKYRSGNPLNAVAALEGFIRFDLPTIAMENCFERLGDAAGASATGDFFIQRRNEIRTQLLNRCRDVAAASVAADYGRLSEAFNRTLAGKYPFADYVDGPDMVEADPRAVVDFVRLFDTVEGTVRTGLANGVSAAAVEARTFLDRMTAVRAFLAPFLVPADLDPEPGYDLAALFRVNRAREIGANRVIEWSFTVGDETIDLNQADRTLRWRPGDPVSASFRWAKDGPVVPIADGQPGNPEVAGLTATFAYDNLWSLVRLLQVHQASVIDFERQVDPAPHTLRFDVRTVSAGLRDAGAEGTPIGPTDLDQARLFVRLVLSSPTENAAERPRYVLPVFPVRAPALVGTAMN